MSNYASNTEIGNAFYGGGTVPGTNTCPEAVNTRICTKVQNAINTQIFGSNTDQTDTSGELKELFLDLWGICRRDPFYIIRLDEETIARIRAHHDTIAIKVVDPEDGSYLEVGHHPD